MKTKKKILKIFAIVAIFLTNSYVLAQTLPNNTLAQTVCVNTLSEPYEVIPNLNSTYNWSIIDQSTGLTPPAGIADITLTANDWWIEIDWTTVGVYELSLVETDVITTCSSNPIVLIITVESNANSPIAINPAPICLNDANPTMTATSGGGTGNNVFNWYSDAALTAVVGNGSSFATGQSAAGVYTYYATQNIGCESTASTVTLEIYALPITGPINHW